MQRSILLFLWMATPLVSGTDQPWPSRVVGENGVVTVQLIPHHEQKRRRRLESGLDVDEMEEEFRQDPPFRYEEGRDLKEANQVAELFQGYGVSIGAGLLCKCEC